MGLRSMLRVSLCLLAGWIGLAAAAGAETLDLSAYKGKVVYLDFWASWCTPCHQSFPWMNQIQQIDGPRGLVVIAVDVDHDRHAADRFLSRMPPQFKIVYDPDGDIARQFPVKDMPTSFVIGRDGKVRYSHGGFYLDKRNAYAAQIEEVLNEPSH